MTGPRHLLRLRGSATLIDGVKVAKKARALFFAPGCSGADHVVNDV